MGVHGLWKLLEPTGEPVALETLENKVLAIDVSMWLHQVLKGYQDASGNSLPNAHLLGLFNRICKLMFFRIKPVFVFDGGVPVLKTQTIINRKRQKKSAGKRAEDERLKLIRNLMEQDILQRLKGNTSGTALLNVPQRRNEVPSLFELPQEEPDVLKRLMEEQEEESSDDDIEEIINWDNFDPNSRDFKMLPALKRLEILNNLKESRKQGSWRRIHDMPQDSDDFSDFQMKRLLVRRSAQLEMDEAEKELSKNHTLTMDQIKEIMAEKGSLSTALSEMDTEYGTRIASDAVTRLIMITNKDKSVPQLAIEEDKQIVYPEQPAIKIKEELPEPASSVEFSGEIPEIVVSDDEGDRSFVEDIFLSSVAQQEDESGLTQVEIMALITNGEVSSKPRPEITDLNQPSTSKAHHNFDKIADTIELDEDVAEIPTSSKTDTRETITIEPTVEEPHTVEDEILPQAPMLTKEQVEVVAVIPSVPKPSKLDAPVDVEIEEEENEPEKSIEIKIIPTEPPKDEEGDDIFSEIFAAPNKETEITAPSPLSEIGVMSSTEESSEEVEEETAKTPEESAPIEDNEQTPLAEAEESEERVPLRTDFRNMNFTEEELKILEEKLAKEQADIVTEIGRQERIATSLSDQVCSEAQELISLFGLPFIVAPMEAEAQCAMLDLLSLTNGTVTDDSDIWLFGGRTVYRNFFNQSKNVERYSSETISKKFMLSRDRLILLAMLVGSDYTIGLQGVGPVTALEIIAEFANNLQQELGDPEELVRPLKRFREWWQSQEISNMRRKKLKTILKNLFIHEGFPSEAVVDAYVHPQVNDSKEKFQWGKPDIEGLIKYSGSKFGWTKSHAESVLDPVIQKLEEKQVQGRIDSYFTIKPSSKDIDLHLSARVRKAVNQLHGTASSQIEDADTEAEAQPSTSRSPPKKAEPVAAKPKKGKKITSNPSKLNEFKQQLTKKPKPLKAVDIELKPKTVANVPQKETIPQRMKNKETALQSKLKAIEVFRKRKIDYVVKSQRTKRLVAEDNHLSESSDSD